MTEKQQKVINALISLYKEKGEPIGPTEIGLALGVEYASASSYCMPALKKGIAEGIVERTGKGKYAPIITI